MRFSATLLYMNMQFFFSISSHKHKVIKKRSSAQCKMILMTILHFIYSPNHSNWWQWVNLPLKNKMFTSNKYDCLRTASVCITFQLSYHLKIKRTDIQLFALLWFLENPQHDQIPKNSSDYLSLSSHYNSSLIFINFFIFSFLLLCVCLYALMYYLYYYCVYNKFANVALKLA